MTEMNTNGSPTSDTDIHSPKFPSLTSSRSSSSEPDINNDVTSALTSSLHDLVLEAAARCQSQGDQDPEAPPTELQTLLIEELRRRGEFSVKLVKLLTAGRDVTGASSAGLLSELQRVDTLIGTLVKHCPPHDHADEVHTRDKDRTSSRSTDSGIQSEEDKRRHGVRFSNTQTGFPDLHRSGISATSEIQGLKPD